MYHIVYELIFTKRKKDNKLPYSYIGCKSNCEFKNGHLYDNMGKKYFSSSKNKNFWKALEKETPKVVVLSRHRIHSIALLKETKLHKKCDVGKNPKYFNKVISVANNYCSPEYATYKHVTYNESIKRLKRDDPLVLSGEYVGATKGYKASEETKRKQSIAQSGKNNSFYGKKHSEKSKLLLSESKKGVKQKTIVCHHCIKDGSISNMKRYHLDNCKLK